jgi:uncharacterized integral membrane protein
LAFLATFLREAALVTGAFFRFPLPLAFLLVAITGLLDAHFYDRCRIKR